MTQRDVPTLGVGLVGYAFMGAAHSQAWRTAGRVFDLPLRPAMVALCGRDAAAATAAAERLGWDSVETDWKQLLARDDIDLVDVCTPGDSHAEIAIAALEAGKHVLCEKPLANTVEEAVAMTAAAERARERGVRSMVAFNYRRVPAIAFARKLWPPGGSATSGTSGRSTCRTGSPTRSSRSSGGCSASGPDPGRWATSAPTSSTWRSSSRAARSRGYRA
jgi:predicted dehydrogenase